MNTPRLFYVSSVSPLHTLPSREQNVHPEVLFLIVGPHFAIMARSCLSKPRSSLAFVNKCSHRFTLERHSLQLYMPFILPDAPHRTDYSQYEGDQKKLHFTIKKISFPKRLSRNQSTNYLCQYVGWGYADHPSPRLMYETHEKVCNGFSLPFPFL